MESETTHLHTNGELHSEHTDSDDDADNNLTTSTPTRNYHRAVRRTPAVFNNLLSSNGDMSDRESSQSSSDEQEGVTGDVSDTRTNGPLLISRQDLRRLESIMSTTSLRSSRPGQSFECDMTADIDDADDDMKEFALQYANGIIQQSLQLVDIHSEIYRGGQLQFDTSNVRSAPTRRERESHNIFQSR